MAAAHVTVNAALMDLTKPNYKIERVNVTAAATGDWYDTTNIVQVTGCMITPAYAMAAADSCGVTFAGNRVTLALVAGAATGTFELLVYGI